MSDPALTLAKHPTFDGVEGPVLLIVMDGVGLGSEDEGDAVFLARTPNLDRLRASTLSTPLVAHGTAVGLPSDADMGNSEVGHNAIGAGRVIEQGAKRVNRAVESGELFEGDTWKALVARAKAGGTFHLMGLLSDGNVHSHQEHCFDMIRRLRQDGVERIRVHVLLDGRDVPQRSAPAYVEALESVLSEVGGDCRIASGGGRMTTTMDRYEADWAMVQQGYDAHVHGKAEHTFGTTKEAVEHFHTALDVSDQFMPAFVIVDEEGPIGRIQDGDSLVFFNFRGDRAIEISRAFDDDALSEIDRGVRPDVLYAGMMEYDGDLHVPKRYLVDPPEIDRTLGEYLARAGVRQFACSETQKFGHVTYFWNGNRSGKFDEALEEYVEIPSDNVRFEQRPWMKAAQITDRTIEALRGGAKALRINYANGDMVGHTGELDASVVAVEVVDLQLARLLPVIEELRGALIVTADHGNADQMFERDKKSGAYKQEDGVYAKRTSHSLNPVPCVIWAQGYPLELADTAGASLTRLAATALQLLGYDAPAHFDSSLLR